jgi:hypothetical protein
MSYINRKRTTISQLDSTKPNYCTYYAVLIVMKLNLKANRHEAWCLLSLVMWRHVTGWLVVTSRRVVMSDEDSTLEYETTRLYRNVGHQVASRAATHPRITETSKAPLRKPKTCSVIIMVIFSALKLANSCKCRLWRLKSLGVRRRRVW